MAMPFSRETYAKEVEEFKEITGADDKLATQMLQVCDGDLQKAVNMHVDGGGFDIAPDQNVAAIPPPSPPLTRDPGPGSSSNGSDYVRPPRAPRQEVLVDTTLYGMYNAPGSSGARNVTSRGFGNRSNLVDPFRDLGREAQRQEEEMERGDGIANLTASDRKAPTLEDLYRPPLDLIFKGSLEAAREEGRQLNKWILVNVVNPENFQCQTLNRDVWSSEAVKDIVKDSFIFWQVYHKSDDYMNYNRFYPIDTYPHVAVIDPRTGERMIVWSKLDACTFAERVTDFLSYQPSPDPSRDEPAPPPKKSKSNGTLPMDEDEQMKAAIAASLAESSTEQQQAQQLEESYVKYLGPDSDPKSELMFRYPDGERKVHSFPSSSKIRALILFAHENGFSETSHELVTNWPRRNLSELDSTLTLDEVGLFPKETIFIQLRSA